MPLRNMVEMCIEVINKDNFDLEVVLFNDLEDTKFVGELVERDKVNWVMVRTDHFSPYALIDKLTDGANSPGRPHLFAPPFWPRDRTCLLARRPAKVYYKQERIREIKKKAHYTVPSKRT